MNNPDELLIIDASVEAYGHYLALLKCEREIFSQVVHCSNYGDALAYLNQHTPDCCILDYSFPGGSAKELIRELNLKRGGSPTPLIVITDHGHERAAIELMQMGVQDYLIKTGISSGELTRAIKNAMRTYALQRQLKKMAHIDALTGLLNRSLFMNRLEQAVNEAKRYDRSLSLIAVDIDHFKQINDTYGHDVGDIILKHVAERIRDCVRQSDSVARLGGDEFMVLLPTAASHEGHYVAQKLLKHIPAPVHHQDIVLHVYPSIGLANFPETAGDHQELLKHADAALYKAKEQGRSQYVKFSQTYRNQWQRKNQLSKDLPRALESGDIKIAYQPIYCTRTGQCQSVEALIRWHYHGEDIETEDIVYLIHQGSLAIPYHQWLFDQAMAQFKVWKQQQSQLTLAINMPANLCHNHIIVEHLFASISAYDIAPTDIILEITETHLMQHRELTKEVLVGLAAKGVLLAIDDFGTGYSSMEHLAELPCNQLKIDQRFFLNWEKNQKNQKIVEAITALGQQLGLKVVAEGIENEYLSNVVAQIGCDGIQGYWLGTPEFGEPVWEDFIAKTKGKTKPQT